jgi:pimeloyl-ACP methyl ester carboxylesterase
MRQKTESSIMLYAIITLFVVSINFHQDAYSQTKSLPVLLVHGNLEDARIWATWQNMLTEDGIPFYTVTFTSDDKCGSAANHAIELQTIVQKILKSTGYKKVNVAAHSKGGLDARAYLSTGTENVANLIMIGTPNAGSPLAFMNNFCAPGIFDLRPGASVQEAPRNVHTKYFTISGDWLPNIWGFGNGGNIYIPGPDDGIVPLSSVESKSYFESLGRTSDNHIDLLGPQEYAMARDTLIGNSQ